MMGVATTSDNKSNSKMTVEEAIKQVREDCLEIKSRLGLASSVINPDRILRIEKEWEKMNAEEERKYSYYEIGHKFIAEHLVASVKEKVRLRPEEEKTLREVIGRIYYNPPAGETLRCIKATEDMARYGEIRSKQIFDAFKTATDSLRGIVNQEQATTDARRDMFLNTLDIPGLSDCQTFRELASFMKEMTMPIDDKGHNSFYI